jgi:hypothetical protein
MTIATLTIIQYITNIFIISIQYLLSSLTAYGIACGIDYGNAYDLAQ